MAIGKDLRGANDALKSNTDTGAEQIAEALIKSIQKKLWVAVALGIAAAGSSFLNFIDPGVRAKAFTSEDADLLYDENKAMLREIHRIDKIQHAMDLRMKQRKEADDAMIELLRQHMNKEHR